MLREISISRLISVRIPLALVATNPNFPSQAQPSHSLEDLKRKQKTREVVCHHLENIHLSIHRRLPLGLSALVARTLSSAVSKTRSTILAREHTTPWSFPTLQNLRHSPWLTNQVKALLLTIRCPLQLRSEMFREQNVRSKPSTREYQVLSITFLPISTSLIPILTSDTNRRELRRPNSLSA